ncbi:MAG: hypothetical protein RIT26_1656 [Pseudomonadota bacterium]
MSQDLPSPGTPPSGAGWRGRLEIRWVSQWLEHPWVRRLKAHLKPTQIYSIPEVSLLQQGNKSLAMGLEWRSIIAAGPKAGRQIAAQSDATHMIEYLGQCVGLGRMPPTDAKVIPIALAVMVIRMLQTERTVVVLHLPEQAKLWAMTVNHRRPYGKEALLSYDELQAWLEDNAASFVHIHSDLAPEDLQAFYSPDRIFPLSLEQALKSQVFRADQFISLKRLNLIQLLRQYPALKWGLVVVVGWILADYGIDAYKDYLAGQREVQRRVMLEKEAPEMLWQRQIKALLDKLPEPNAESMQAMLTSMNDLPVSVRGWQINRLLCQEKIDAEKSGTLMARAPVDSGEGQLWNCTATYSSKPNAPSATYAELLKELPGAYEVHWKPLKNFELSWSHRRTVQALDPKGLGQAAAQTLALSSLLQEWSTQLQVTGDMKWQALPMPAVRRSDGSDAPKPKSTELPVYSALSLSGRLDQLSQAIDALPADWRSIELSFSPAISGQTGSSDAQWPSATFSLKGVVYATQ